MMNVIGTGRPIHDAKGKVTGRLHYAGDLTLPHMAHIAMIFSSIPHGRVRSIDASKALELEGVYGVFHCFNTPDYRYNRYRSQFSSPGSQMLPAPTAIVCAISTFSTCAMSCSNSALRFPSTISPT